MKMPSITARPQRLPRWTIVPWAVVGFVLSMSLAVVPGQAQSPSDLLARIAASEKRYAEMEGPVDDEVYESLRRDSLELLTLGLGPQQHRATSVFFARRFEDPLKFGDVFADDTIHVTEFPHAVLALANERRLEIRLPASYPVETLRFYLMRDTHGRDIDLREIPLRSSDSLELPDYDKKQFILFAVLKGKADLYFKKFVWIVRP